jgi:type I restriction enzyme S subunit
MKNWDVKKLGEVCSFFNGQAHEKCIDENGKYKLINSKFVSSEGEKFKKTNSALSPLYVNDIVMVMSDVPNGKTLAKCFVVDEDDTYTLNQRICVIRSKNFDTRFLYYQLNRNKYLLSFNNGENQSNLRKDDILNCELFVPPLSAQQRIVAVLDEAFVAIDKAKANAEQNLKNSKELFDCVLDSILYDRRWKVKTLGDVCSKVEYGSSTKSTKEGQLPVLRMGNIQNGRFIWDDLVYSNNVEDNKQFLLKFNDVLFNRTNSPALVGKTAIYKGEMPAIFAGYLIRLHRKEELLDADYLNYYLNSKIANEFGKTVVISSVNQANINGTKLKKYPIPLPALQEQKAIVQKLDALSLETKKLEAIYQQKINDLEELKKSVLQKAFSGELKTKEVSEI